MFNIKNIIDSCHKLENILINNINDFENLNVLFDNLINNRLFIEHNYVVDPEVAKVKKSKRPIDQVCKLTNKIIATYESIEACGRSVGCTGSAIGISVRNKTLCKGYLFRYSGLSKEQQYVDQKVIKVNCNTGEKINFDNIASAAKDANVSAPGLRNRLNCDINVDNFHWIWDESASHYN